VRRLSATEVARNFADVLDHVEHTGEIVLIERRGRPVARIEPAAVVSGSDLKALLRNVSQPDDAWAHELRELRESLPAEDRSWSD
jgi:prevent-host-death family protein